MKKLLNLSILLFLVLSFQSIAQGRESFTFSKEEKVKQEIIQLSKEKWQWMADKNIRKLATLFHDKSKFVHMSGSWNKSKELDIIKTGRIWYKNADVHDVVVEIFDNTAILWNRITLLAVVRGKEVSNEFTVTEIYKKQESGWKLLDLTFSSVRDTHSIERRLQETPPIIKTESGMLHGVNAGEVDSFKGVPYAIAPVGEYRWRPPHPLSARQGVLDNSEFGADCAQAGWGAKPGTIVDGSSEDCLFLNLWRPAGVKPGAKVPVMVWIHGGAFMFGSGSQPSFSGVEFAKQNVILVTFNYRLGRLGFFAFPALSDEHPEESKGNYAYMDQIAALNWVQNNITAFGGDPNNVTIFGESAGGVSVHSLLTIPLTQGLFHKGIIESGGGRNGVLTGRPINKENADSYYPVSAETIGVNFARKHSIDGSGAAALAKLRALTVENIVDGGQEYDGPGGLPIYSGPILDGKLVVETAQSVYQAGKQASVPLIIGSNSAEVPAGFVNAKSKKELWSLFGNMGKEAAAIYDPNGAADFAKILTMVNTDKVWAEPARFTANAFAAKGESAYVYLFSYVPSALQEIMKNGAPHGSEVAYVFNNLSTRRDLSTITPEDKMIAKAMNTYWVNFAKNGDPNGKGLPKWLAYNSDKNEIIEFQLNGTPVSKLDPKKARLDIIQKAVETGNLH